MCSCSLHHNSLHIAPFRAWYIEMFASRCSSFRSIVPCSFESILMPKSLVQECYILLTAVTYQNLVICYFCCNWCVHLMSMISACVLIYAIPSLQRCMPCIFVIYVVTSTSMQTRLRDVFVFRDLGFLPSPLPAVILLPCIPVSTLRSMLILSKFSKDVLDI